MISNPCVCVWGSVSQCHAECDLHCSYIYIYIMKSIYAIRIVDIGVIFYDSWLHFTFEFQFVIHQTYLKREHKWKDLQYYQLSIHILHSHCSCHCENKRWLSQGWTCWRWTSGITAIYCSEVMHTLLTLFPFSFLPLPLLSAFSTFFFF